jgi:hypothetical protein
MWLDVYQIKYLRERFLFPRAPLVFERADVKGRVLFLLVLEHISQQLPVELVVYITKMITVPKYRCSGCGIYFITGQEYSKLKQNVWCSQICFYK